MSSRMEKYNNNIEDNIVFSRTKKFESVYDALKEDSFSRVKASENIKVLDDPHKEINVDKIKKYLENNKFEQPIRKKILAPDDIKNLNSIEYVEEERDYDINSVLEKAKEGRSISYEEKRYKKINDIDYDILTRINVNKESKEETVEDDLNTNERTLVNLINTIKFNKEETSLLSELVDDKQEDKVLPIEEEIKNVEVKQIESTSDIKDIDKSFYTNSLTFDKKDFEGLEELEKTVKKASLFNVLLVIFIIIVVLGSLLVIANNVFELNII